MPAEGIPLASYFRACHPSSLPTLTCAHTRKSSETVGHLTSSPRWRAASWSGREDRRDDMPAKMLQPSWWLLRCWEQVVYHANHAGRRSITTQYNAWQLLLLTRYTRHSTLANRRVTVKMVYDSSLLRHAQHEQPFERHQGKTRDGTWSDWTGRP